MTDTLDPPTDATRAFDALPLADRRAAWTTALVDGGYVQGHGALRVDAFTSDPAGDPRFCVLGVAEDVRRGRAAWRQVSDHQRASYGLPTDLSDSGDDGLEALVLTHATCDALGLVNVNPYVVVRGRVIGRWVVQELSELNDTWNLSLTAIAAVVLDQGGSWDGDYDKAFGEARRRNVAEGCTDDRTDADEDEDEDDAYHEYDHTEETDDE